MIKFLTLIITTLVLVSTAGADSTAEQQIRIYGKSKAVIKSVEIKLDDIADIKSASIESDDIIIGLKKIVLEQAPAPGKEITLSAMKVLERMRSAGVNLKEVGYSFPRIITVKRAAQLIGVDEIKNALQGFLNKSDMDAVVERVNSRKKIFVSPGKVSFKVQPMGINRKGSQKHFAISAEVGGISAADFNISAKINEWKTVPVASRPLARGAVISEQDVKMARLNIEALPTDAAFSADSVIGREVKNGIGFGEVFRKNRLDLPPVVNNGSRVTLLYKNGLVEATAAGTALEAGLMGQDIRVRNNSSRKILSGRVIEPGLIGVN